MYIDGPNPYTYVNNNPVNYVDPWGLEGKSVLHFLKIPRIDYGYKGPMAPGNSLINATKDGSMFAINLLIAVENHAVSTLEYAHSVAARSFQGINPLTWENPAKIITQDQVSSVVNASVSTAIYLATHTKKEIKRDAMQAISSVENRENIAATAVEIAITKKITTKPKPSTSSSFFKNTKYTDKVKNQMLRDKNHGFPSGIDKLADEIGSVSKKTGGDKKPYIHLMAPGSINGKKGIFEYIKDSAGNINHRFFRSK